MNVSVAGTISCTNCGHEMRSWVGCREGFPVTFLFYTCPECGLYTHAMPLPPGLVDMDVDLRNSVS